MKRVRIVLVDDHQMVRESLRTLIDAEADLVVVGEADDGATALEQMEALRPDLLLLDISMPGMSGIELMEHLRGQRAAPRVIVLTAYADSTYLRQLLDAGATGYVLKRSTIGVLVEAIRTVMAGGTYLDPGVAGNVVSGFLEQKKLRGSREGDALTDREREVLQLIPDGLTTKEIAVVLGVSRKTIESHRASLMEKLNIHKVSSLVRFAVRVGLVEA